MTDNAPRPAAGAAMTCKHDTLMPNAEMNGLECPDCGAPERAARTRLGAEVTALEGQVRAQFWSIFKAPPTSAGVCETAAQPGEPKR